MRYKKQANEGKRLFIKRLTEFLEKENLSHAETARRVGVTKGAVSLFLRSPEECSENFIREVSVAFPELSREYLWFRYVADRGFIADDMQAIRDFAFPSSEAQRDELAPMLKYMNLFFSQWLAIIEKPVTLNHQPPLPEAIRRLAD